MKSIPSILQSTYHRFVPERIRQTFYHSAPESLRKQWDNIAQGKSSFSDVTEDDVYYCYRLFLKRKPTKQECQYWFDHATQYKFTINRLVQHFLYSDEFIQLQKSENQPYCVDLDSFKLFVRKNDYATGSSIAQHKSYEPLVAEQIKQRLSLGDTFIDIGANIGYHAMLAASIVGKNGQIIAFEPLPSNCELLALSISENKFEQVTVHPYAVGEKEDILTLMVEGTYSNAHLKTSEEGTIYHTDEVSVRVVTLDTFLTNLERVDMVKIDIEGVEPLAWRGMENLLRTFRPLVLTEFFPAYIKRASQIEPETYLEMMEQQGYDLFVLPHSLESITPPHSKEQILQIHAESGFTHLDILAVPQ
ncbi:hypothetical protein MNBD_CHLOROFLEXI01-4752 [hydrothermal vent metagenome]|uniref:Methyltransferase FkbM domain-containing protein n=1 Tax=hydrothermal vent metagenome TaxID=652676 RepID=A0A3B0VX11_9ZZZZ